MGLITVLSSHFHVANRIGCNLVGRIQETVLIYTIAWAFLFMRWHSSHCRYSGPLLSTCKWVNMTLLGRYRYWIGLSHRKVTEVVTTTWLIYLQLIYAFCNWFQPVQNDSDSCKVICGFGYCWLLHVLIIIWILYSSYVYRINWIKSNQMNLIALLRSFSKLPETFTKISLNQHTDKQNGKFQTFSAKFGDIVNKKKRSFIIKNLIRKIAYTQSNASHSNR